ncbi:hypothetical protein ONS95_010702 [Cadophora gregata]|uniref:uncharacterized protein n=1 Tax=Cadophora gregata TaxID=51156 RepID=UPI0026DD4C28|nr:uncharacterized protein ONS95_010702 [Cadophora gregata]KAK0122470.1 hypothetical protein ONS95_010702 [Cadophora gregata]KAK0127947.1 hypothetical protein ONS96_007445 [Cadophora gregata f. sp. sojae]
MDDRFADVARDPDVRRAIDLIYTLPVSPPEHRMLVSFIRESVDAKSTALYVLARAYSNGEGVENVEAELRKLFEGWRELVRRFGSYTGSEQFISPKLIARDNRRCCATGTSSVWWDMFGWSRIVAVQIVPDAVLNCIRDEESGSIGELLSVFLTAAGIEQLTAELHGEHFELRNTWTLRQDVATAFKNGQLFFQPGWNVKRRPEEDLKPTCQYSAQMIPPEPFPRFPRAQGGVLRQSTYFKLSTFDADALPLPSSFLCGIHARFSVSLRSIQVHQEMSAKPHVRHSLQAARRCLLMPLAPLKPILQTLWCCVPEIARISVYKILLNIGLRLYGPQLAWVQRVPFGIYIKHGRGNLVPKGEASALLLVEKYTKVKAPKLIDSITRDNYTYLVMTRVPGVPLSQKIPVMSYPERKQLAIDLRAYLQEFQNIPNTNKSLICDADGGAVFDYRIPGRSAGPFQSEEEFNNCLITQERLRSPVHSRKHRIVFTHADLDLTNVLVDAGRLSGLVDFGCAGFYPEYWEFTKGKFIEFGPDPAWTNLLAAVFGDEYLEEFEAEEKLWAVNSTM